MKKLVNFWLILLMVTAIIISCSKEDDDDNSNNNNNPPAGSLTCKVDGVSWTASLAVVATNSGGVLSVTGSDSNSRQCALTIMNVSGTGNYTLGVQMNNPNMGRWTQGLAQNDTYSTMLGQGSGEVQLTELTSTGCKGTFHFTAKNGAGAEVSITEGSFQASFTK